MNARSLRKKLCEKRCAMQFNGITLRGLCQLFLVTPWKVKKSHLLQWKPKNNSRVLSRVSLLVYRNYRNFLPADGKDGNGLQREKVSWAQPRSQSSSAKIDVTSPVNLIGNFAQDALALSRSVPSLWLVARFARIARVGLGTRLSWTDCLSCIVAS